MASCSRARSAVQSPSPCEPGLTHPKKAQGPHAQGAQFRITSECSLWAKGSTHPSPGHRRDGSEEMSEGKTEGLRLFCWRASRLSRALRVTPPRLRDRRFYHENRNCGRPSQPFPAREADRLMRLESAPVHVSSLVLFEFRQSLRLQAFRFSAGRTQGFSKTEALRTLETLQANIAAGRFMIPPVEDWAEIHSIAEELSAQHTMQAGHRSFDVLHVAAALHLKSGQFLTFDARQAALAKVAALKVKP